MKTWSTQGCAGTDDTRGKVIAKFQNTWLSIFQDGMKGRGSKTLSPNLSPTSKFPLQNRGQVLLGILV